MKSGNGPSALREPAWQRVAPASLDAFTAADWAILDAQRGPYYAAEQAPQVLRMLAVQRDDPSFGYAVNNYRHCVQAATLALRDGRDDEYVVAALLHDVGFVTCPTSHGAFAAALLGPYVSDATRWLLARHADVQTLFCRSCPGNDVARAERWRGHPHFAATLDFVARYDIATIAPGLPEADLDDLAPRVHRILARPPRPFEPDGASP
jgi:predicted HD phosphohydrolase